MAQCCPRSKRKLWEGAKDFDNENRERNRHREELLRIENYNIKRERARERKIGG